MKMTVQWSDFEDAFKNLRPDNFTREGLSALFDYLEEYEEDTGEEIELDVVALCCDFSEYETCLQAAEDHGYEPDEDEDEDEREERANEWLLDRTTVIGFKGGVIIQSF